MAHRLFVANLELLLVVVHGLLSLQSLALEHAGSVVVAHRL